MTAYVKPAGQETTKSSFLKRLSLRNKIIGAAVLVVLVLIVISIPGDRNQLLALQERVDAAQVAYDLAMPAVAPTMEGMIAYIESTGIDMSGNRQYTGLSTQMSAFNRANSTVASRSQAIATFSQNTHGVLDGTNAVAELDEPEFRALVADMDTTLSVAWLALMELNEAVDEYNGYHSWISAKLAAALSGLPPGYSDPLPATSRLNPGSLTP